MFGETIFSTQAMESYNHIFTRNIEGDHIVINATEGGMPITGAQNLSLREAIYMHCKKLIQVELIPDEIHEENKENDNDHERTISDGLHDIINRAFDK